MRLRLMGAAALALSFAAGLAPAALAQNEQFIPGLIYRSGAYAPNGIPFANGVADYYSMINERDGGINGVKILYEECDTGYDTARGVECYERLKNKGPTGAAFVNPLSTGITFALTEKAPADKVPIITMGYGRSESADGSVFQWNFPLLGTYWSGADIIMRHIANGLGGYDKLKGKKVALVFHDSPYGKEPISVLEDLSKKHGYEFMPLPVAHPGVEQKATWLQIRQQRPDFVLLWGWGVMNSTSIKEAAAVGYPRNKMFGIWWSGAEPDVLPAGEGAKGYNAATLQHGAGIYKVHQDVEKHVVSKGRSQQKKEDLGNVLYNRGLVNAMLGVEAIRKAQDRYGKKPLTGEQIRWGIENLDLSSERLRELGFEGMVFPVQISCNNHEGETVASRIHQWDGKNWNFISDWIRHDKQYLRAKYEAAAKKYATEKNITPRDCSKAS